MRKATRRLGKLSGIIAAGVAIAATGTGVMAASYSTFNANTSNGANTWNSGSLTLVDDDTSAMFTVPTSVLNGVKCIRVTSGGSYNGPVKLWGVGTTTGQLSDHINLTVEVGATSSTGGFSGTCTGFTAATGPAAWTGKLSAFDTAFPSYTGGWDPQWTTTAGSPDSRMFRFTWSYDDTAPQGQTASNTFTWEVHSS